MQSPLNNILRNLWNKISIILNHTPALCCATPLMRCTSGGGSRHICPCTGKWDGERHHQSLPRTLFPSPTLFSPSRPSVALLPHYWLLALTVIRGYWGSPSFGNKKKIYIYIIPWVSSESVFIFLFMWGSLCKSLKWNVMIQIYD